MSQKESMYQEFQAVGGYFVLRLLLNRQQTEPKGFVVIKNGQFVFNEIIATIYLWYNNKSVS